MNLIYSFQMNVLHQSVPNLEQLQMSSTHIDDLVFLSDYFSKLSNFTVHFTLKDYPQQLEIFKKQAFEQGVIVDETVTVFRSYSVCHSQRLDWKKNTLNDSRIE